MTQSEQIVSQVGQRASAPTRKDVYYPALAVAVGLAFAANAWFFYHQGQDDALNTDSANLPSATIAWTVPVPPQSPGNANPADAGNTADATQQPAAQNETAKPAGGDNATADKPAVRHTARARPANRMLAKATAPATPSMTKLADRNVALLSHPKPAYPMPALRGREQGTVLVVAQVDATGRVSDTQIARRSGSYVLDRAATNEVRRWKFEPAIHNGQPVAANVQVPVSYQLGD
jgi:protein TonB